MTLDTDRQITNLLRVRHPQPRSRTFTVCYSPLHSSFSDTFRLIHSIQLNAILGAEHFFVYNFSISAEVDQLLRHYANKGIVTIRQWPLPTLETWYFGQVASLNDCLFMNRKESEYVVIVDTDEFIVPRLHNNWHSMIEYLDQKAASLKPVSPRPPLDLNILNPKLVRKWLDPLYKYPWVVSKKLISETPSNELPYTTQTGSEKIIDVQSVVDVKNIALTLNTGRYLLNFNQSHRISDKTPGSSTNKKLCHLHKYPFACKLRSSSRVKRSVKLQLSSRKVHEPLPSTRKSHKPRLLKSKRKHHKPRVFTRIFPKTHKTQITRYDRNPQISKRMMHKIRSSSKKSDKSQLPTRNFHKIRLSKRKFHKSRIHSGQFKNRKETIDSEIARILAGNVREVHQSLMKHSHQHASLSQHTLTTATTLATATMTPTTTNAKMTTTTTAPSTTTITTTETITMTSTSTTSSSSSSPPFTYKLNLDPTLPIASFQFRTAHYIRDNVQEHIWEEIKTVYKISQDEDNFFKRYNIHPALNFLRNGEAYDHDVRSKSIVRPALVHDAGIHKTLFMCKCAYNLEVDLDVANVFHYRTSTTKENSTLVDTSVLRFKDQLKERTLSDIFEARHIIFNIDPDGDDSDDDGGGGSNDEDYDVDDHNLKLSS